jgi:hypothetical protein
MKTRKLMVATLFVVASVAIATPRLLAAAEVGACSATESRQLDFWVGDWHVSAPGSAPNAASKVTLAQDKCVVIEDWDGGRGHTGENMFAYSADDHKWHGMFTDNRGRVHIMEGTGSSGEVQFSAPSRDANGKAEWNRVRIVREGPDRVKQIWGKSTDNGATWTVEFQGTYERGKP